MSTACRDHEGFDRKSGVVKVGRVGDEVSQFAVCVIHRGQLIEAHSIGYAVGQQGLAYAPVGVPSDLLFGRFMLQLEVGPHAAGLARHEALAFCNPGASSRVLST